MLISDSEIGYAHVESWLQNDGIFTAKVMAII
jgi:hypothetical protein